MSFWSSASVIGVSGLLALLAVGRGEALDQLAGDADDDLGRPEAGHLLGFLERDRAVVDDGRDVGDGARLHVRQALALAPDAADRAVAGRSMSKTSALANSVPTSRAVQAASASAESRCQMRRQKAIRPRSPRSRAWSVIAAERVDEAARASCRVPWAISGRPPPRPSIAGIAAVDEVAGRDPAGDEVVRDGHEQLRLVGIERERDHARAEDAAGRRWRPP